MKYLALDSSTEVCSVALFHDGEVTEEYSSLARSHAKLLLPMAEKLLTDSGVALADLDALLLSHGPGSFTGIRIGLGVAQGLAYGANLPIYTATSLDIMAQVASTSYSESDCIVAALDARMKEVYWAAYRIEKGKPVLVTAPAVCSPERFNQDISSLKNESDSGKLIGIGHGWGVESVDPSLCSNIDESLLPRASALISLYQQASPMIAGPSDPVGLEPVYLRNEVSWEKRKRIRSS